MKKALFCITLFFAINQANSGIVIVQNTNDSGVGSLRQATIDAVNGDTIRFNPAIISSGNDTIKLVSEIGFNKGLVIKGLYNSTDTLFVSGEHSVRIFNIDLTTAFNKTMMMDSMVLVNGATGSGNGGALYLLNCKNVLLLNSIVSNNFATNDGGGIYSTSSDSLIITLTNSIVSNNSATDGGGGIYSYCSSSSFLISTFLDVNLINSTVSNNSATDGGGIYSYSSAIISDSLSVTLTNSTISNNSANSGGGIYCSSSSGSSSSEVFLTNSTVFNNSATSGGGIRSTSSGSSLIKPINSILASNGSNNINSSATVISLGYNIFSDVTMPGSVSTDYLGVSSNLLLDTLKNNGGTTLTMAPLCGSIAINNGNPGDISDAQNGSIIGRRDIGAAEYVIMQDTASIIVSCDSLVFNSNTYYNDTLLSIVHTSLLGCDSTIIQPIIIKTTDYTTFLSGLTITANQNGATYQWIDCANGDTMITNETNQSFTATTNGDYAVIVTNGSCNDTSACVTIATTGLKELYFGSNMSVYPNPTNGEFTIYFNKLESTLTTIQVINAVGQVIKQLKTSNQKETIDLNDYENGVYFIKVKTKDYQNIVRLIKQ